VGVPFGKYHLIASLGRGGMADVYLAATRGTAGFRKLAVIKRLREDVSDRRSFTTMLLDEARLAARLQHPNVVQTFEVGVHEGQHYIAMEYLEGQPIARILAVGGRPDSAFATRVMADVLAGLHYAHELTDYDGRPLSIVHRDVSPQNLFVTYAGEAKVVDFGVAKTAIRRGDQTEAGVLKGKLAYMAPEQLGEGPIDRRADVFSAGIVFWELLTGRRLWKAQNDGAAIAKVLFDEIPPPSKVPKKSGGDVPAEVEAICMRAVSRDPEKRWQSAGEMREALYAYMESTPGGAFRRDEVGRRVASLFEKERADVRARITEFMATSEEESQERGLDELARLAPDEHSRSDSSQGETPTRSDAASSPSNRSTLAAPKSARPAERRFGRMAYVAAGVASIVVGLGIAALVAQRLHAGAKEGNDARPDAAPVAAKAASPILTLEGSGTLGVEAAPAVVEGFLKQRGATSVRRQRGPTTDDDTTLFATMPNGATETVLIRSEGTAEAFQCLARRTCDIAMAARDITDAEATAMLGKGVGELRSASSEHVVALDGIAVVVHPDNPVRTLSRADLAAIFAGEIDDWSAVGGKPGKIALFAHEEGSGTFDVFSRIVLNGRALSSGAKRLPDNASLSDAVAVDAGAIAFVGLAFVRNAKAVAISDKGVAAMIPSPFTITTEAYLLARRFYLYSPAQRTPLVHDFLSYVASPEGQKAIRASSFVDLDVTLKNAEPCEHCPAKYATLTKRARRLSLDFRFRPDKRELDARAVRDLDRVVRFLRDHPSARILLLGFSDATNDARKDQERSRELAQAVDAELAARGIHAGAVEGFGGAMPVATTDDAFARFKNRRVEIWIES
jgi:serine/threonine protein kinase/ABC-type phosphate transport system substrate-binding protein